MGCASAERRLRAGCSSVFAGSAWAFLTLGLAAAGCSASEAAGAAAVLAAGASDAAGRRVRIAGRRLWRRCRRRGLGRSPPSASPGVRGAAVTAMPVVAAASSVGLACAVAAWRLAGVGRWRGRSLRRRVAVVGGWHRSCAGVVAASVGASRRRRRLRQSSAASLVAVAVADGVAGVCDAGCGRRRTAIAAAIASAVLTAAAIARQPGCRWRRLRRVVGRGLSAGLRLVAPWRQTLSRRGRAGRHGLVGSRLVGGRPSSRSSASLLRSGLSALASRERCRRPRHRRGGEGAVRRSGVAERRRRRGAILARDPARGHCCWRRPSRCCRRGRQSCRSPATGRAWPRGAGAWKEALALISDVTLTTGGLSEWNCTHSQQGPGQPPRTK